MNEQITLLCQVLEKEGDWSLIKTWLQDDAEVELSVRNTDLTIINDSKPTRAWLNIQYHGENNGVASITLPRPILDHGHRICVSTDKLKRASAPPNIVRLQKGGDVGKIEGASVDVDLTEPNSEI